VRAVDREEWNRRYADGERPLRTEPSRFLVAEADGLAPGRALDLACGAGRHALWLAERGWRVTGVDFAGAALATARRLASARGLEVDWIEADLLDYEPPQGAFDLVLVLYLQVPADERRVILGRAAGAVAPSGALLVVGHHADNLAEGVGGPRYPEVLYTEQDVAADLAELELVRAERVLRPVEGEGDAIDVLVSARRP
jgi:SAM-dependent methyltransferase